MGGKNCNKPELTDEELINKLQRILKCLESEDQKTSPRVEEGDEWFKARKEKMRIPKDSRTEEIKLMLAEKAKQTELEEGQKKPETVLNTIYPLNPTDQNEGKKEDKVEKECKKNQNLQQSGEIKNNGYPSQTDLKNIIEYGLLQGPHMDPFVLEMVMGEILVGCKCIKRNGLQGDCKRKLCRGKKTCLQLPLPLCVPSGYGKLRPKEVKVYMGEIASCPKEEVVTQEKTVKTAKKQTPVRKDYIDTPPCRVQAICKVHQRGKYYIRPSRRNKSLQTDDVIEVVTSTPSNIYPSCPPVDRIAA